MNKISTLPAEQSDTAETLPTQQSLDTLFEGVTRMRLLNGGAANGKALGTELLLELSDAPAIAALYEHLSIIEDENSFFHCMCLGEQALELYRGLERIATIGLHHGRSIRWDGWEWDAELVDGHGLLVWLAEQGVASPLERYQESQRRAEQASQTALLKSPLPIEQVTGRTDLFMDKADKLIGESVKQLVSLVQNRPFRFKETKRADAVRYLKQLTTFAGLSEAEINTLETSLGVNFPTVFRSYLQSLGKARGDLFKDSEVDPQKFKEYRQWAEALLQENDVPSFLTDTTIVFLFHQGYSFTYFEAEDTFDVPVYLYVEGSGRPQKIAETFSEFLEAEIQRMEQLDQTYYLNGGYFLTVNQQGIKQTFPTRSSSIRPLDNEDRFID